MNNQLITTQTLTKKIVAAYFRKLVIDHDITIDEQKLSQKIEITFDDCKKMSAGEFIGKCEKLRFTNLYGKLPKSADFVGYETSNTISCVKFENLCVFINNLAKDTLVNSIVISTSNKAVFKFNKKEGYENFMKLDEKIRNEIKEKVSKELGTIGFDINY